jgi:hypothetical protein
MLSYAKGFPLLNASSMTIEDAIEDNGVLIFFHII